MEYQKTERTPLEIYRLLDGVQDPDSHKLLIKEFDRLNAALAEAEQGLWMVLEVVKTKAEYRGYKTPKTS